MKSAVRNIFTGIALSASALTASCTINNSAQPTPKLLYPNIPVVPHDKEIVGHALSGQGEIALDNPGKQSELVIDGGDDAACIATVIVSTTQETDDIQAVSFTPGIATAYEDLHAIEMDLSVHLDVDIEGRTPSTTIPASQISNKSVMENTANDLLDITRKGCEIWARDIAPMLGN